MRLCFVLKESRDASVDVIFQLLRRYGCTCSDWTSQLSISCLLESFFTAMDVGDQLTALNLAGLFCVIIEK